MPHLLLLLLLLLRPAAVVAATQPVECCIEQLQGELTDSSTNIISSKKEFMKLSTTKKMLYVLASLHSKTDFLFLEVSEDTSTESKLDSMMRRVYPTHLSSLTDTAAE
jgi:hypothetical protein